MIKSNYKLIRKLKYFSFKYGLPRLFPSYKLNFVGHASSLSKWINEHKEIGYTNFPNKKFDYSNRLGLFQHVIESEIKDQNIDYFEFGVAKGISFRWWANEIKKKKKKNQMLNFMDLIRLRDCQKTGEDLKKEICQMEMNLQK